MGRPPNTLKNTPEVFNTLYKKSESTKCWIWQPLVMRFRVGMTTHHPRRYAYQLSGRVIPPGVRLFPSCGNDRCCNPDHVKTVSEQDPCQKLLLRLDEFGYTDKYLARKYLVTKKDIAEARLRTLELIVLVKRSHGTLNYLSQKFGAPPLFIRHVQKVTLEQFEEMKKDPNILDDEEHFALNKGQEFRL